MKITLTVEAEVRFTGGKFASKASIAEALQEAIEGADPGSIEVDEGNYDVESFEVSHEE